MLAIIYPCIFVGALARHHSIAVIQYGTLVITSRFARSYLGPQSGYTEQLSRLEAHSRPNPVVLPAALLEITTPLIGSVWERELAAHPNQTFAAYVMNGVKHAF